MTRAVRLLVLASLAAAVVACGSAASTPAPSPSLSPSTSPASTPTPAPTATLAPNYVVRGNMARSYRAFTQRKAGRVAFLGGSVTNLAWRERVMSWLQSRYPGTTFDFVNAGLNGTPAELGAFRLEEDVFARGPVDLLFLEFAVNGGSAEAMEGIVRHARALSPDIDIVQMHIAASWFSEGLDKGELPGAVIVHEQVAEHYGNSSLHLYQEVYDRIKAGEFTWEQFSSDSVHPNEFGNSVYADFITGFLDTMWSTPGAPEPASTPSSMTADPWEHGSLVAYSKATSVHGFTTVKSWTPENNGNLKAPATFLAASTPGASISFSFRGTKVGLYTIAGPDSAIVEYRIDDGAWTELDTARDSWYPNDWYRLAGFVLTTSLADGPHAITFRTLKGQAGVFRLYRLMVG